VVEVGFLNPWLTHYAAMQKMVTTTINFLMIATLRLTMRQYCFHTLLDRLLRQKEHDLRGSILLGCK